MKKNLLKALIVMLALSFTFTACGVSDEDDESSGSKDKKEESKNKKDKKDKKKSKKKDIDELKSIDGLMFAVYNYNWGLVNTTEDYWSSSSYLVYYDGTIVVTDTYNLSGDFSISATIDDDDYIALYEFGTDAVLNDTYADTNIDACDGDSWDFCFYDEDGKKTNIYSGYSYGVKGLEDVQDIISGYIVESGMVNVDGLTIEEVRTKIYDPYQNSQFIENYEYDKTAKYNFQNVEEMVDYLYFEDMSQNVIFSDASLNMALGLLLEGADSDCTKSLTGYLAGSGYKKAIDKIRDKNNALINIYRKNDDVQLSFANSLFYDTDISIYDEYSNQLLKYYDAMNMQLDFTDYQSANVINDWCSKKTNGKIKEIITPEKLAENKLILANALYFNGLWEEPFEDVDLVEEEFTNSDRTKSTVTMMYDYGLSDYFENDEAVAFAKYYEGGSIAFIGILPKEEGDFLLSDLHLEELMANKTDKYKVNIKMPKFKLEDENSLSNALKSVGLSDIFESEGGHFLNMGDADLYVSDVVQKTYVDVNETGTEAAAVTAINMTDSCAIMEDESEVVNVYLDRQFAFMIYDFDNDVCLFAGKIVELED